MSAGRSDDPGTTRELSRSMNRNVELARFRMRLMEFRSDIHRRKYELLVAQAEAQLSHRKYWAWRAEELRGEQ
jgi:hypothetical protein